MSCFCSVLKPTSLRLGTCVQQRADCIAPAPAMKPTRHWTTGNEYPGLRKREGAQQRLGCEGLQTWALGAPVLGSAPTAWALLLCFQSLSLFNFYFKIVKTAQDFHTRHAQFPLQCDSCH